MFKTSEDQWGENKGNYHNPMRQRGIFANTAQNAKTQSLTYVSGCDGRKRATSKCVSEGLLLKTRRLLSLTDVSGYEKQLNSTASRASVVSVPFANRPRSTLRRSSQGLATGMERLAKWDGGMLFYVPKRLMMNLPEPVL